MLREERKKVSHFGTITLVTLFVIVVAALTYVLFFGAVPRIEIITPAGFGETAHLTDVEFAEIVDIVNNTSFQALRSHDGIPGVGVRGRANPFVDYR